MILDEPFVGIDLARKTELKALIKKRNFILVTHDLAEAISMADRIVVLTKRPARIKNIYQIKLTNRSTPFENRKAKEFVSYYEKIWKDLDIHV